MVMRNRLSAATLVSAVLAAMVGSTPAHAIISEDSGLSSSVQWFAANPSEFRAFLGALHQGRSEESAAIAKLAGLSVGHFDALNAQLLGITLVAQKGRVCGKSPSGKTLCAATASKLRRAQRMM
jgi:hypothetical protein